VLLGCTVSPGFEFDDYEAGERVDLCLGWPEFAEEMTALARGVSWSVCFLCWGWDWWDVRRIGRDQGTIDGILVSKVSKITNN